MIVLNILNRKCDCKWLFSFFLRKSSAFNENKLAKLFINTGFMAISDTIEDVLFCFLKLKKCTKIKPASDRVYGDIDEGVDTWDGFGFV